MVLRVDVEDTGPGMPAEQVTQLFSPFTQADSSVLRRHGGTGLGLTISQRLAQVMGGSVALVRTEPGKGSLFRVEVKVEVPRNAAWTESLVVQHATAVVATVPAGQPLNGRVLLAEDGPDNQRLIAFHLRTAGAKVDTARDGIEALAAIDAAEAVGEPYALLVSDMQMPEMDGYTLAGRLRARGSTMPIVALTAPALAEDREKCLEAGCDDYATKPIYKLVLVAVCAGGWANRAGGAPRRRPELRGRYRANPTDKGRKSQAL